MSNLGGNPEELPLLRLGIGEYGNQTPFDRDARFSGSFARRGGHRRWIRRRRWRRWRQRHRDRFAGRYFQILWRYDCPAAQRQLPACVPGSTRVGMPIAEPDRQCPKLVFQFSAPAAAVANFELIGGLSDGFSIGNRIGKWLECDPRHIRRDWIVDRRPAARLAGRDDLNVRFGWQLDFERRLGSLLIAGNLQAYGFLRAAVRMRDDRQRQLDFLEPSRSADGEFHGGRESLPAGIGNGNQLLVVVQPGANRIGEHWSTMKNED